MSVRVACKWLREMAIYKMQMTGKKRKNRTLWNQTRRGNGYQILLIVLWHHCVWSWSFIVVYLVSFEHKTSNRLLISLNELGGNVNNKMVILFK